MRALLDLIRGPATGLATTGVYWRGRLVCAIDGTILCCADTPANLAVYHRGGGYQGGTGYPMVRVLALVACGTRTIIDVVFGTDRIGETSYAHDLLGGLRARDDRAGRPQLRRRLPGSPRSPTPAPMCWSGSRPTAGYRSAGTT